VSRHARSSCFSLWERECFSVLVLPWYSTVLVVPSHISSGSTGTVPGTGTQSAGSDIIPIGEECYQVLAYWYQYQYCI
jgi:hypothetical protein